MMLNKQYSCYVKIQKASVCEQEWDAWPYVAQTRKKILQIMSI